MVQSEGQQEIHREHTHASVDSSITIHVFHNPFDRGEIFRALLFGSLMFIGLTAIFSLRGENDTLTWTLTVIASLGMSWFAGLWNELWLRPKEVEIKEDGVLLIFWPWRPRKFLGWSDIQSVAILPEDPKKYDYKEGRDGFLWSYKKKCYALFWPIANSVREAYKEKKGEYPPITHD